MNTRLLLFFLLAASLRLVGQIGFQENIVIGSSYTTPWPELVKAADLDGDNDLDIIAYGRGLNWYENIDGMGNFGEKKIIAAQTTGPVGTSLYAADFDNDGDLDLLGAIDNKFTLYKNTDGLGNFTVMQNFVLGLSYTKTRVVPADIDGDGDIDLLSFYTTSTGPFQGKLIWYENDGSGNFGVEQVILNNNGLFMTSLLYTDDLDGDNDADIIIGFSDLDKIVWLENTDGNGAFSTPVTITVLADGLTSIYTADMDNDGDMDIISSSKNDNQIAWYTNLDGQGNFSDETIITSSATATNSVIVTDINNDNTKDIVFTSINEIRWLSNTNGLGTFGPSQMVTNKAFGVRGVITADLDGDGKNDLISASRDDDKVAWYRHVDGNGLFGRQVVIARIIDSPNNVYPADLDGDNDIDLLVNSQHDAKLTWFENVNGLGFYGKEHVITESIEVGNITPIAYPVDIDGDGDLDIATCKNSVLLWYKNTDGQGNFTEQIIDSSSSGTTIIRSKDLDGDGDMDLVCVVFETGKISWYKNLGNGIFGPELVFGGSGGNNDAITSLEIADIDGDNDMDVVASSYSSFSLYYYKNTDGLGNFASQSLYIDQSMQAIYPGDVDGDGDNDIIGVSPMAGGAYPAVFWYENTTGLGNFPIYHTIISSLPIHGESIYATDLDNDGDLDVLTAAGHPQTSGQLAWYKNNGDGTFSPRQMIHETFNTTVGSCVNVADIDNDNDMDVLAVFGSNSNYGKVSVFENLGNLGNSIHGKILIDSNSDGCTNEDMKGSNLMVISTNGSNSFATFTNDNGVYDVSTNAGNFNTSITSQLPDYFISNPTSHGFNFSGMNNAYLADFCLTPAGAINDLSVTLYPSINDLRPGFDTYYRIVYKNNGTTTLSGTINFEYNNNKLIFLNADQVITTQTANTLTFDFTDLNPFETRIIDLAFTVFAPPITNINDAIFSEVSINAISEDATEEDNSFVLSQTVIGSYDPNDITCIEGDQVQIANADNYLHYLIRFQNTGTASAINVRVENSLDSKLDWTSMQLESFSHNGRVEITDGNEIEFIFNNIYLPDSTTNEPNSHGFIAYKIKPLQNVVVGDIVNNTADIYFDFNPPINTNTYSTEFIGSLSINEIESNQFTIYPNPTMDFLNIRGITIIDELSLFDINGRILKEFSFETPTAIAQLDLREVTNGIYFLRIKSQQGTITRKIIKR